MSDYVIGWPWQHFGESSQVADMETAIECMSPVPVVYVKTDAIAQVRSLVNKGIDLIVITGQSDFCPTGSAPDLIDSPHILRWYAQSPCTTHPKLEAVPIGLNCFEHAPEMARFLASRPDPRPEPTKDLFVNFGDTYPTRSETRSILCAKPFSNCVAKTANNNVKGNPQLLDTYALMSQHKFLAAPRGNGVDSHRFWEALLLGVIPIVKSSVLDDLYSNLPTVIVDDWNDVDQDLLDSEYARIRAKWAPTDPLPKTTATYWRDHILGFRDSILAQRGISPPSNRLRCWG